MNLSTVAIMLLAYQLLTSKPKSSSSPLDNLSQFMSDDTKSILSCVEKLSDKDASKEDKTGAIFQMMTNPAVMNVAESLFKKKEEAAPVVNEEGYKFDTPSKDSQEFFRQVDNIADAEVKHKLYWFYDNWYIK